ncbi:metalloregulator ArsR/SmtB family transcription factor [Ectobacillus antri]|jgi:predicted transcriptional regulator|uniref:Metalloregulator ArsR/SmtB family transcription factor n=1 Tax=Ectobacillus antri TaxID=2486280 RepID=A0ABT6H0T5_9BACI|nr:metalloregulator ArsR/SmtB family transcription factor [Ectobacillus antri]MDG4655867.1 metalloregulator ArsR/SmtB family transcription factor [Ectobacillus antri]MDG5752542.1 metalloregulator ArsR/SmtB family transcription factor [Ectobacillus antri]
MQKEKTVDSQEYVEGAEFLKVTAHQVRLGLLNFLLENGPTNVTTLYQEFEMPQSTISQHLAKLKQARIIRGNRKGLEIYYHFFDETMQSRMKTILKTIA